MLGRGMHAVVLLKQILDWELPPKLAAARRLELTRVWVPEVKRECELIEGEDAAAVAARLLGRLEELKLLTRSA